MLETCANSQVIGRVARHKKNDTKKMKLVDLDHWTLGNEP